LGKRVVIMIRGLLEALTATFILLIFFPLLLIIASVLFFTNKGEVLFRQDRIGYNGAPFHILKFRTIPETDRVSTLCKNLWHFLRITGLDELPQLVNIIKGDMGFIGPRPLLTQYATLLNLHFPERHSVKPGLIGYAQVNGRNSISWQRKLQFDRFYIENRNWRLDFILIFNLSYKIVTLEYFREYGREPLLEEKHIA